MFGDGPLTFREFATREPHPVAVIHDAVLGFLRGRNDAVLQGGQAINAYVTESRWTADMDIASPRAAGLAEELQAFLDVMAAWKELVAQDIRPEEDEDEFQ